MEERELKGSVSSPEERSEEERMDSLERRRRMGEDGWSEEKRTEITGEIRKKQRGGSKTSNMLPEPAFTRRR